MGAGSGGRKRCRVALLGGDLKAPLNVGVNYTENTLATYQFNFTALGIVGKVSFALKPSYAGTVGISYHPLYCWNYYFFWLVVDSLPQ